MAWTTWELVFLFFAVGVIEYRLRAIEHYAKRATDSLIECECLLKSIADTCQLIEGDVHAKVPSSRVWDQ